VPPSTLERLADNRRVHDDLDYRHWGGDSLALRHPDVFLASYLLGPRELATLAAGAPLLHDDRPVLEYETSVTAGHLSDELDNVNAIRTGMGPLSEVMEVPATAAAHIDYLRSRNVGQLEAASWLRRLEGLGPAADHAEIADAVRRALAANPDNAKANRIAGDLASLDGHYAEALPFYALATADRPDDGVAHRGYANALMNAGRPLEAADHYRAALLDLGENADLRNDLGMCVGQSGDLAGAAREFRRALALDPNHAEARGNLQRVRLMIAARQSTPVARPAVPPPRHD
jgi:tetratricopeptide (TPR) repeat protein